MKVINHLLPLFFVLFLFACENKETSFGRVNIQLLSPEGYSTLSFAEIEVTLTNKEQGTAYKSHCSSTGLAVFNVEHGEYTASVYYQANSGWIFSGRLESLLLSPEQEETMNHVCIQLLQATSNALVIKEIYYSGCTDQQGKMYLPDQYVTLYNNSNQTIYLDGLCMGVVDPSNSKESPWMKYTDMNRIPVNDMTWQFPGSGQEHPLLPGTGTTIATNAVDHTGGAYQNTNSVNLSRVDWAFWNEELENVMEAGVTPMNLIANLNPSAWRYALPVIGPAFVVFSLQENTAEAYVNNPANLEPRPQLANQNKRYLMIPKEWVIDCIDCVESAIQLPLKRVPNELDNGAAYLPTGFYSGKSLIRKHTITADGRVIYQDTNNSAQDLEVSEPTQKRRK